MTRRDRREATRETDMSKGSANMRTIATCVWIVALTMWWASPAVGQESPDPPIDRAASPPSATGDAPGNGAEAGAGDDGATPPDEQAEAPGPRIVMNFRDASLETVLAEMSARLGLVVIDGARIEGRVTVVSAEGLTRDEAVDTLNTVLKSRGYAAVLTGRKLRVVTLDEARKSNIPVRSGSDPERIGRGDTLVRQVIPVRFAKVRELARDLGDILPEYAVLAANESTNTLIYTATEADVRHLVEIVRALDVGTSEADAVRVFRLTFADATSTASLIQNIFAQQSGGSRSRDPRARMREFFIRRMRGGPPGRGGDDDDDDNARPREQRVVAAADSQTNSVVVSAPPELMAVIAELVDEIDTSPLQSVSVRVFPLEYADADRTATLIEDIFGEEQTGRSSGSSRFRRYFGRGGGDESSGLRQEVSAASDEQTNSVVVSASPTMMEVIAEVVEQLDTNPTAEESIFVYPLSNAKAADLEGVLQEIFSDDTTTASSAVSAFAARQGGRTASRGGRTGAEAPTPTLSRSASDSAGDLAGKVYVVAEENTNSLLVRTAPKYFERVKEILKELDRSTRQVLIKVLIAEVTLDDALDLGAEFSVLNIGIEDGTGTVGTNFGVTQLSSGLVARYVAADFEATLRALDQVGKLEVLSRPYLMGSENQAARITVGEEVPYITNSRTTDTGQTINTVEYRDVGIIMEVTPYIGPDGMVIMDLFQEISSRTGRTVTVSEDFEAEVYAKRSAETRVAVSNGRTVVIGGLMEDNVTETVRKIPLLGDIPLIGHAFKRTQRTKSKTELLIFLCPRTALTPDELKTVTDKTRDRAGSVRDAVESGAFDRSLQDLAGQDDPEQGPEGESPEPGDAEAEPAPPPTDEAAEDRVREAMPRPARRPGPRRPDAPTD